MSEEIRKVIFLIGFIAIFTIRLYFAGQVKEQQVVESRVTILEKILLLLTILGTYPTNNILLIQMWIVARSMNASK